MQTIMIIIMTMNIVNHRISQTTSAINYDFDGNDDEIESMNITMDISPFLLL